MRFDEGGRSAPQAEDCSQAWRVCWATPEQVSKEEDGRAVDHVGGDVLYLNFLKEGLCVNNGT